MLEIQRSKDIKNIKKKNTDQISKKDIKRCNNAMHVNNES